MSSDNFTQKEILLQVMTELRDLRTEMGNQRVLLQTHIEASNNRDAKIAHIEKKVDDIETKIQDHDGFKTRIMTAWGVVWSVVTLFAVYLLNRLF
jgi:divalent metal cation (Fe/Co/Zn/Cd) transporter